MRALFSGVDRVMSIATFLPADPELCIVRTCCTYGYPHGSFHSFDFLANAISNTDLIHIAEQWNHCNFFEALSLYVPSCVSHRIADNSQLCLDTEHER